jgi:hypothetical protein
VRARVEARGSAWKRVGARGSAWERVGARGSARECVGTCGRVCVRVRAGACASGSVRERAGAGAGARGGVRAGSREARIPERVDVDLWTYGPVGVWACGRVGVFVRPFLKSCVYKSECASHSAATTRFRLVESAQVAQRSQRSQRSHRPHQSPLDQRHWPSQCVRAAESVCQYCRLR